jgi:hypothetical protein
MCGGGRQSLARAEGAPATFDTRMAAGAQQFERDLRGYVAIAAAFASATSVPEQVQ